MSGEFDPVKAAREVLAGIVDAHKGYQIDLRESEQKLAEAEARHNRIRKLEAYAKEAVSNQSALVRHLEEEAERKK